MLFLLEEFVFVSCSEQSDLFAPGYIWEKKRQPTNQKKYGSDPVSFQTVWQ